MIATTFHGTGILYDTITRPEPPVPGLKCGHDIAPITARIKPGSALRTSLEAEHKVTSIAKDEKQAALWSGGKTAMADSLNEGIGAGNCDTKPVPCDVNFSTIRIYNTMYEIETIKSNKFLQLFTSCGLYRKENMRAYVFILIIAGMFACSDNSPKKVKVNDISNEEIIAQLNEPLPAVQKNDKLISFKSIRIMDMDKLVSKSQKEFQRLQDNVSFHKETDTILYLKDTLYISYLTCVNASGYYDNNIEFHNDSLILKTINLSKFSCMCERIDRFIYKIYNPDNKKFLIVKK